LVSEFARDRNCKPSVNIVLSDQKERRQENVERANYVRRKEWETFKKARVMGNDGNYYF